MNNVHPTVAQALDPFYQAIGASQDPAPKADQPPAPSAAFEREWYSPGYGLPDLALDVFYYDADPGRYGSCGEPLEPSYSAGCEIQAVWLGKHDIMPLLSEEYLQMIEAQLMGGGD